MLFDKNVFKLLMMMDYVITRRKFDGVVSLSISHIVKHVDFKFIIVMNVSSEN